MRTTMEIEEGKLEGKKKKKKINVMEFCFL
jgi:hypothetical protein